ncbi:MAG: 23S rRNA (adenine(2030)-N(6))-methyltransferase RlmJ [Devosia sp.]|uniref:23S rRNA (adenine(2030)-N(6))-methyltransferase RlmJ n=1 Tax=Devosia sp. TaxID=1871048 RepID=UPI001AD34264|nr:23S rRNA (adenine(2030)-N(6))-methyltransferase RlmJ [Devosia sp.]MBN9316706.1 23S rRNA (adenine(2030)-N(6))-methyltransferase RlmJ [Devosia sp.]
MNYSHAFHAGNFADVMKHIVLARLVEYLKKKDSAFRVIDTHAGIGRYDLTGEIAKRSPEWVDGVGRLLRTPLPQKAQALVEPYLNVIRELNPGGGVEIYPGSPLLVRKLFRPQDRLSALELHPEYAKRLGILFEGDVQVRVIHLDGWLALNAHVPPKEKRGLVLVDPPFEEKGEFDRMVDGLVKAHKKFAGGIYALWYPLKDTRAVHDFVSALHGTGIPKMLRAEVSIRPASNPPRLHGSGLILVNPPFTLEGELRILLPALAQLLGDPGLGRHKLEWIRGEA